MQNQKVEMSLLMEAIATQLDISPSKYQEAVKRYNSIKEYLEKCEYDLGKPEIYPQGSFKLGTIIRPLKQCREGDYDIDLVCQFKIEPVEEPATVKNAVRDQLKKNATYLRMMEDEGRRCWTLNYTEQDGIGFHIDILPSTREALNKVNYYIQSGVERDIANQSIAITNKIKQDYEWLGSNPAGYAEWFMLRQRAAFIESSKVQKIKIASENRMLFSNEQAVPDLLVRTPLQRAVQLLKRHRDTRFSNSNYEEYKPVSIIITTLAATLYNNESTTNEALEGIIKKIQKYVGLSKGLPIETGLQLIQRTSNGRWKIVNPVCPDENFADKWHEDNNSRANTFFLWVEWLIQDFNEISKSSSERDLENIIKCSFGERVATGIQKDRYIKRDSIPAVSVRSSQPWMY